MSTVDLMLLSTLMKKPMSAYEMKKEMEDKSIQNWIKISSPSVYKNLIKLCSMKFIDGKTIREGEMPEKTIYSINDKGKKYFMHLMKHYSEDPGKVYVDFCAFISNLENLDYETGLKMIENLQQNIVFKSDCINGYIENTEGVSFYGTSVIKLYSQMYEMFKNWIQNFKKEYEELHKKS